MIDREGPRLGVALRNDTVFEALHFLPLYYADDDGSRLIAVLRSLSNPRNALASAFPRTSQRKVLAELADALEAERSTIAYPPATQGNRSYDRIASLDERWAHAFVPRLSKLTDRLGIKRGTLIVSAALRDEGRIVLIGDSAVIAVGMGRESVPDAPLYAAVRELCFPLIRRFVQSGTESTRLRVIELGNRAATRCGAMVLDRVDPALASGYRRAYMETLTDSGLTRAFDTRFPLSSTLENSLRAEIARVMTDNRAIER